jgi:hypothetical protein
MRLAANYLKPTPAPPRSPADFVRHLTGKL